MLKAGSLVYAIIIALIIALTSSSLIVYAYYSSVTAEFYLDKERVIRNARSGINLLLSRNAQAQQTVEGVDLFGEGRDSVLIQRKNWGAFEVLVSTGVSKHNQFTFTAFAGDNFSDDTTVALYLSDMDRPLSLCGKTVLKGTCFLPKAGTKRAYIEGQNFVGAKLVDGTVHPSKQGMPELNKVLLDEIVKLFKQLPETDSLVLVDEAELPDSIIHPFSKNAMWLYSGGELRLENHFIQGNVGVVSARKLIVESTARLEDVVLIAPEIEFKDGFEGNVQVFASDTVMVGKKCKLHYPSVIGLIRVEKSVDIPSLVIDEGTEINGVVFAWEEKMDIRKQMRIVLKKESLVNGHVYSSGLIDLQGSVYGSVACNKFILSTPSSVYENHLLNAVIDRSKLSKYFVGINLLARESNKKVIKWIY